MWKISQLPRILLLQVSCFGKSNLPTELVLPIDIVIEILCRLPVKSVVQCKCVCKLWCGIIQDRQFIEKHMKHSELIYVYKEDTSFRGLEETFNWLLIDRGLVLEQSDLTNRYRIRNPATKQILYLPNPCRKVKYMWFSHIPAINNYKLVYVYCKEGSKSGGCEVLTIGIDSAWRTLDIPGFYNLGSETERSFCRAIDDVFFVGRISSSEFGVSEIVYLEMGSESFGALRFNRNAFFQPWKDIFLVRWKNKFALTKIASQNLHVWILEDYKKQKWAERKIVIPLPSLNEYPGLATTLWPQYVTADGWLHFHVTCNHHVIYDIESKMEVIKHAPAGKRFDYWYYPSLEVLEGSQPEGK